MDLILVSKGLIWGNGIGIGLGMLQKYLKIIPLDPINYYMSHVPISLEIDTILYLNLLLLLMIGLTLLIPVTIITRVQPLKAIRFD